LEELRMEVGNVYQTRSDIQRQVNKRHARMDGKLQKHMAFNEKLNKLLEETRRIKPFNYDNVFTKNNEFKKYNILLEVKLESLLMEEIYVDLWWDAIQDIRKACKRYEKNERLYRRMIFQMEKVVLTFEYEPLILSPELETLYEENNKGNIDGVGPLSTKTLEEEPRDFKGGKDSPKREVGGETYALKQTL
jgi:hypothetical protein